MIRHEVAVKVLDYNPQTGKFIFKEKDEDVEPRQQFRNIFNTQFAGKEAFCRVSTKGYFYGTVMGKRYSAHRMAFFIYHGRWPKGDIDHINGNPQDNRINNLREVSKEQNLRNMKIKTTNNSGFTGVFWSKNASKWTAQIRHNQRAIHLGYFDTLEGAICARKEANKKYGYHPNHGMR